MRARRREHAHLLTSTSAVRSHPFDSRCRRKVALKLTRFRGHRVSAVMVMPQGFDEVLGRCLDSNTAGATWPMTECRRPGVVEGLPGSRRPPD